MRETVIEQKQTWLWWKLHECYVTVLNLLLKDNIVWTGLRENKIKYSNLLII